MVRAASAAQLISSIADAGRELLRRRLQRRRDILDLCRELLSVRGEASGTALAREVVEAYRRLGAEERLAFFQSLRERFGVDGERLARALDSCRARPDFRNLQALRRAAEPPRQELFRRINLAPDGTRAIVGMRADLLKLLPNHPELTEVDADLLQLLSNWFNPGFLSLTRIDWNSPASLLEKIQRYEKVHAIAALENLKRRLAEDRRCFAFFHPALPDEPLIFVEVALTRGLADRIAPLVDQSAPVLPPRDADTAIFYSINACQEGLRGVTLGSFLIKLVVAELQRELPHLRQFATLSPVPGFRRWLERTLAEGGLPARLHSLLESRIDRIEEEAGEDAELSAALLALCARYLVQEKEGELPLDPVARFHLRNGARLERINWAADRSSKGLRESFGIMVNYLYEPGRIERYHERFVEQGEVTHAAAVRTLLARLSRWED